MITKVDEWYSSLSVKDKETISSKILDSPVSYPECTGVWINCSNKLKEQFYTFCMNRDISDIQFWGNEEQFSY